MNRTDRLTGIILALRGGRQTSAQLARRFEVSRRTILRDLDTLGEIGVPVVAVAGVGGGFALPDGYWLPPLQLTGAEATALLLGLAALGPPGESPFGEPRRTAEEKIRAVTPAGTLRATDDALRHIGFAAPLSTPGEATLAALREAIPAGRWLRITYRSPRRVADHDVLPVRLVAADGHWYVDAVSRQAAARRRFRTDRIDALEPIPTPPDADEIVRIADADDYHAPEHPEVVFRLSGAGAMRAPDAFGVAVRPVPTDDGRWELRFRCPPAELPFYARAVLSLGGDARAVAPAELVDLIRDLAWSALNTHPATGDDPLRAPDGR